MNISPIRYSGFNNITAKNNYIANNPIQNTQDNNLTYSIYKNSSYSFMGIPSEQKKTKEEQQRMALSVYEYANKILEKTSQNKDVLGENLFPKIYEEIDKYQKEMLEIARDRKSAEQDGRHCHYRKGAGKFGDKIIAKLELFEREEDKEAETTLYFDEKFEKIKTAEIIQKNKSGETDRISVDFDKKEMTIEIGKEETSEGFKVKNWYYYENGKLQQHYVNYEYGEMILPKENVISEKANKIYRYDENEKLEEYMERWRKQTGEKASEEYSKSYFKFVDGAISTFDQKYKVHTPDINSLASIIVESINHIDFTDLEKVKFHPFYSRNMGI